MLYKFQRKIHAELKKYVSYKKRVYILNGSTSLAQLKKNFLFTLALFYFPTTLMDKLAEFYKGSFPN